jgi:hypothetical protein
MEILPLLFMQAAVLKWNTSTTKSNHIPKEAEDGNPAIVVHASSSVEMEHMYHKMQNTSPKELKMEILPLLFMQAAVLKWNTCTTKCKTHPYRS